MMEYGFENGDRIVQIGDGNVKYFSEIGMEVLINGESKFIVERDGQELEINLPEAANLVLIDKGVKQMFSPLFPFAVLEVMAGSNAKAAGMQADDIILSIAGEPTPDAYAGITAVKAHANETVDIVVMRGDQEMTLSAEVTDAGTIGFKLKSMFELIETETYEYGLFESIPAGFVKTGDKLGNYISSMKLLFTKEGASQIGGFGAIGGMFSPTWDWHSFWSMTAFLSLILAFMNILPIPALDGGHVMFLLYEIVTGRKPGDKFMEYTQTVGMVILLGLLVFANGNDLVKLFMD